MTGYSMIDALADFTRRVDELDIPYMVTGSFAMSSYVPARATMDIDVIVEVNRNDAVRFEERFIEDYYVSAVSIRRAADNEGMFNIINNSAGVKIDCIIRKSSAFEKHKFSRRSRREIFQIPFWVISKEDLILSKLRWAKDSLSERQFEDISVLVQSGADESYIGEWVQRERLSGVWDEFQEWKIRIEK